MSNNNLVKLAFGHNLSGDDTINLVRENGVYQVETPRKPGVMETIGSIPGVKGLALGISLYMAGAPLINTLTVTPAYAAASRDDTLEKGDLVLDVKTGRVKPIKAFTWTERKPAYGNSIDFKEFLSNLHRGKKEIYNTVADLLGTVDENGKIQYSPEKGAALDKDGNGLVTLVGRTSNMTIGTELGDILIGMGFKPSAFNKFRRTVSRAGGGEGSGSSRGSAGSVGGGGPTGGSDAASTGGSSDW